MVRNYIRKTDRVDYPPGHIVTAVQEILLQNQTVTSVSLKFSIPRRSLLRYLKKAKEMDVSKLQFDFSLGGYKKNWKVFTDSQENLLVKYLKRSCDIYYGLTTKDTRKLAYDYARKLQLKCPANWTRNLTAGKDWLVGFLKRNHQLSIRKPQATSLSRATSFNRHNVGEFFDLVENLKDRGIPQTKFYNADEVGFTTVHRPDGVLATRGKKQIGSITSAERGTLVTVCVAVSSCGTAIPPYFVFPRARFKNYFMNGAPLGSAGSANKSGWMTNVDFVQFMNHFISHVRPSKSNKVALFLDNHSSHLSIDVLNLAKDNGILMITFPPHCSHKLQPLDRSVFGPMKGYFNSFATNWMRDNPAKPMTINDIAGLVGKSFPLATTPCNIMSGFRVSGLVPFNRFIFENDHDFAPSFVTDRPAPTLDNNQPQLSQQTSPVVDAVQVNNREQHIPDENVQVDNETSEITLNEGQIFDLPDFSCLTDGDNELDVLEDIRPFPKAAPRISTRQSRRKRKTSIVTDTPVKKRLEEEQMATLAKKIPSLRRRIIPGDRTTAKQKKTPKKVKGPAVRPNYAQNDENVLCIVCQESWLESVPNEKWVKCVKCPNWAHNKCVKKSRRYTCDDCFDV